MHIVNDANLLELSSLHLRPDPSRTVIRPLSPEYPAPFADTENPRMRRIVERVLALDAAGLRDVHDAIMASLRERHRDVTAMLLRRFEEVLALTPAAAAAGDEAKLVIGAYFSGEYSFEAAALFNPSMVLHPNQDGVAPGTVRFLLSLRGIGEGHVSSVTFRTGNWSAENGFSVDAPSPQAVSPVIEHQDGDVTCVRCEGSRDVSESVLFPVTPSQHQGIEDMRLVRFVEDDGTAEYLGTYTAYDGRDARCELVKGRGFQTFEMHPLKGSAAAAKGMALFPRRIDGRYWMLGRQDSESIWLLDSDDLKVWDGGRKLVSPRYPWEFVQVGNCGSPIEIDEGWLVLTHGVGMVRNYCMGACLLDRKDPARLLARTAEPILRPSPAERDGYVANVVYSCGGIVHDRTLLLPFGIADNFASFASVSVDRLLAAMV